MPTDELSEGVMDHSPEAIGVRDLGATGQSEITDSAGNPGRVHKPTHSRRLRA